MAAYSTYTDQELTASLRAGDPAAFVEQKIAALPEKMRVIFLMSYKENLITRKLLSGLAFLKRQPIARPITH